MTYTHQGASPVELAGGAGADKLTGGSQADEITGGAGDDSLVGGGGADKITGGAGADYMDGGDGVDQYIYSAVSDSQLTGYAQNGDGQGADLVAFFVGDDEDIVLPKALFGSLRGRIKKTGDSEVAVDDDAWLIDNTDDDDDGTPTADSLKAFIEAEADGFFETTTTVSGSFGGTVNKHSVALVYAEFDPDGAGSATAAETTWLFIDVDGDGDFDSI